MRTGKPAGALGFSLIEVVIAMALLGAVLISVSGLFVLGTRQIASGRAHTTALAAARDIIEQMNGWSFSWTYQAFEISAATSATVPAISTLTNTFASRWQTQLDERLPGGYAEIRLESVAEGTPPDLNLAAAIRVVVTVHWKEGARKRQVSLATVRM